MVASMTNSVLFVYLVLFLDLAHLSAGRSIHTANLTLRDSHVLVKRLPVYPNKATCETSIAANMPPTDKAMFFTGGFSYKEIRNIVKPYAESKNLAHLTETSPYAIWSPSNFANVANYQGSDPSDTKKSQDEKFQFLKDISAVYAEKTNGIAYLYMSYKKKPAAGSIFFSIEFAAMKASGSVSKIIWLDADARPDDPTAIETTWWVKGAADPSTDSVETFSESADCGLTNYWDAHHCPLNDGIDYLHSKGDGQWCTAPGACTMPSCSYGTGISICNDNSVDYCTTFSEIGDQAADLQGACDPNAYYDDYYSDCNDDITNAMQQFFSDGHNILITGGYDC